MMKKVAMFVVVLLASTAASAAAQEVVVRDGPPPALRKNLDAFKAAVNGTADQYEAAAKTAFTEALFKSQTPAQRKAEFEKIRASFGTIAFEKIERNGGPDDPRIALIEVTAESAYYLKSNQPRLIALFNVAKAIATGNPPKAGDAGELDARELAQGSGRA